jgi:AcrR family transcriptional regulator
METTSTDVSSTRRRLLDAARQLLEEHGPYGAGMQEIARAAGLTRQSVYLHFGSKTGLLLALVEHVDADRDVAERVERLWEEPSALAALESVGQLAAWTNPEVHRIAMALDAARRWDSAFEAAWQDRMSRRLARYRRLTGWLKRDKALGSGWTASDAASLIWSLTSIQTYEQLVVERRMPLSRYARLVSNLLRASLTAPFLGNGPVPPRRGT